MNRNRHDVARDFPSYAPVNIVVPFVSFGRLKCDRLATDTPRRKLRWGGLYHRRGQHVYLTAEATSGVGLLFVILAVAGGFLIYYFRA